VGGLVYFGLFFVVFVALERAFPARRQKTFRPRWLTDAAFYFGQYLLWTSVIVAGLVVIAGWIELLPLASLRSAVASQPMWLQIAEVILLCDVCVYWGHRASHRFNCLWRFHRVHHTVTELDWLAAYREHPADGLYTRLIENLPALLFGFPMEVIAGFVAFRGLWGLFIHSNVSLRLGPLEALLGAPRLHHWHHELSRNNQCNFANLSPLMDIIFGTFYDPKDKAPQEFGTLEELPQNYVGQLFHPLIPSRLRTLARRPRARERSIRG
jgi:sterol desaturase/sphingolipid hydroxylase (fatty acid hydroxylase superfamily)